MKGRKIVGKASEQDQKNLTDWHKKKFPKKPIVLLAFDQSEIKIPGSLYND